MLLGLALTGGAVASGFTLKPLPHGSLMTTARMARAVEGPQLDRPGSVPRQNGDGDPSEDGTPETPGDGPSVTTPDDGGDGNPPGCPFRDGPFELYV